MKKLTIILSFLCIFLSVFISCDNGIAFVNDINEDTSPSGGSGALTPITVTADVKSIYVGNDVSELTYTTNPNPLPSGVELTGALACTCDNNVPGAYPITQGTLALGGKNADKYYIVFAGSSLTVLERNQIVVTPDPNLFKFYDEDEPAEFVFTYLPDPLPDGVTLTGKLTRKGVGDNDPAKDDPAGSYEIINLPEGDANRLSLSGENAGDYNLTVTTGVMFKIYNPNEITVNVKAGQSKIYGEVMAASSLQYDYEPELPTGYYFAGDMVCAGLAASAPADATGYEVEKGELKLYDPNGDEATHFTIIFNNTNKLVVNKKTITVTANSSVGWTGVARPDVTTMGYVIEPNLPAAVTGNLAWGSPAPSDPLAAGSFPISASGITLNTSNTDAYGNNYSADNWNLLKNDGELTVGLVPPPPINMSGEVLKPIIKALHDGGGGSDDRTFEPAGSVPADAVDLRSVGGLQLWRKNGSKDVNYYYGGRIDLVGSCQELFNDCKYFTTIDLSGFGITNKVKNMKSMFQGCQGLDNLVFRSDNIDTSEVTDMSFMFINCRNLAELDLSLFNTAKVQTMQKMFMQCTGLETLTFGENFKANKAVDMSNMFNNCGNLTTIDVSAFRPVDATDMSYMFYRCKKLSTIDVSRWGDEVIIDGNSYHGMRKVTNFSFMFAGTSGTGNEMTVANLDVSGWHVGADVATPSINLSNMFDYCKSLTGELDGAGKGLNLSNWDFSKVVNICRMFDRCEGLKKVTFPDGANMSNVTNMLFTFAHCKLIDKQAFMDIIGRWKLVGNSIAFTEAGEQATEPGEATGNTYNRLFINNQHSDFNKGAGVYVTVTSKDGRSFRIGGKISGTDAVLSDQRFVEILP